MSSLGKQGEVLAVKYLKSNKFKILDKNFRCSIGEIDVVTKEKDTIVFIEVKTRRSAEGVAPFESVGARKQAKIRALAEYYLQQKDYTECEIRFDVLSIVSDLQDNKVEHIRDAF